MVALLWGLFIHFFQSDGDVLSRNTVFPIVPPERKNKQQTDAEPENETTD